MPDATSPPHSATSPPRRWWVPAAAAAALVLVAWLTLFHKLGASTLNTDPVDESIQGGVAVEMARTGRFVPTLHGEQYRGKPPLKLWIAGRFVAALGPSELALRLPDAIAATLTGLLIAGMAWRAYGPLASALAAVVLWSSPHYVLLHGAREGVQDAPITLLVTVAVAGFGLAASGRRLGFLVAAAALAAAVLVKSLVGLLPLGIGGAILVAEGRARRLVSVGWAICVLAPVVAFVAWFGTDLLNPEGEMLYNIGKRATAWPKHRYPWHAYGGWLRDGMALWAYPAAVGALWAASRVRRRDEASILDRRACLWALGILVPFSLAVSKLPWYAYPMYPAAALLAARALAPPEIWRAGGRCLPRVVSAFAVATLAAVQVRSVHRETRVVRTSIPTSLVRALPTGERMLLHGLDPTEICPDEEMALHHAGILVTPEPDGDRFLSRLRAERAAMALVAEDVIPALADRAPDVFARARIARFAGGCDLGMTRVTKRDTPRRALLVLGREDLPRDFAPHVPVRFTDGFYAAEPEPEHGQMQWLSGRGTIEVGGEGPARLRLEVQPFHRPRTLVVRQGHIEILRRRIDAWTELVTEPFDRPPGGVRLQAEALEGCDEVRAVIDGSHDRRCLSFAVARPGIEAAP